MSLPSSVLRSSASASAHRSLTAGLGLAMAVLVGSTAGAAEVTYEFRGTINDLEDLDDVTEGATSFSLVVTYDTASTDLAADPQIGIYGLTSMTLTAGAFSKSLFADPEWHLFESEYGLNQDSVNLHAQNGLLVRLIDLDGSTLDDPKLPWPLPDLAEFEQRMLSFFDADEGSLDFSGTITEIKALSSPCPEDVNFDGHIDTGDLFDVILAYGPCDQCSADVDESGYVAFEDIVSVLMAWGTCSPTD